MRRALRRAALALLTAGVSGLARPALAQPLTPGSPASLQPADVAREGRLRLEEMKVEMAWLADPLTFPHPIIARTVDGNLELRGTVADARVREAALALAKAHTRLSIINTIQIGGESRARETGVDASAIRQGVVEVLNETFGMSARGFEIRAESDGVISVSGSVNSVEEKLAVSRSLRKVRGCTCVSNYLQISPMMVDGRMVTQINLSGSLVVPGQVLCLDGAGQGSTVAATPAPPAQATSPPVKTLPAVAATPLLVPQRPATRSATVQVQATVPSQPAMPTSVPTAIMPIEVPLPPASRTNAADRSSSSPSGMRPADSAPAILPAPSPSFVTNRTDANSHVATMPVTPPAPPTLQARDSVAVSPPVATHSEKDVDLLAVPTVPRTWTQDTRSGAVKPKTNGPTSFATAHSEPVRVYSADDLHSLPTVSNNDAAKTVTKPTAPTPKATCPSEDRWTTTDVHVPPVPTIVKPATTAAVMPPAKLAGTPVVQQPAPLPAPAPLTVPAPTAFKETWVDALPAPTTHATPGHPLPPPGGWPAAHDSRPAPTAYVTSGLLVFPDGVPTTAKTDAGSHDAHTTAPAPGVVAIRAEPMTPLPAVTTPAPVVVTAKKDPGTPAPVVAMDRAQPVSPAPVPVLQNTATAAPKLMSQPLPATPASAARLKQQIERACGRLASSVEVLSTEGVLTVRVKCVDGSAAQKATERILVQVPEMSDTKVKFEVEVGK